MKIMKKRIMITSMMIDEMIHFMINTNELFKRKNKIYLI